MNPRPQDNFHLPSVCERNKETVLKLANEGHSLAYIGRTVGTTGIRVREFLDKNGVVRDYPTNYGGARNPAWKGGKTMSKGYVKILVPDHPNAVHGYVLEHRLVMEKMIGRYLLKGEVVHHKNGVHGDNRPENLKLFSENTSHLKHELTGRTPKWTEEGLRRMREGIARSADRRRGNNDWHWRKKRGVLKSQQTESHSPAPPQTNLPLP